MSFLSPGLIALAAGLTIPPLVALYFLKLKRQIQEVPSTLLWKRAVEDLHVNSPFQRLRRSLLLLLQLLILLLAAIALGKPMLQQAQAHLSTVILLVDHSASMGVEEEGGKTRLDLAKLQAKQCIDNLDNKSRAMIIAFCDQAVVMSPFDTDKAALKAKIDSIEQTQSTTALGEAISLAEAYAQNITIGTETAGRDIAPESAAPSATVFLFTDGRIADSDRITLEKFDAGKMIVRNLGSRSDNVGVISLEARRNYEYADLLEVSATMRNFSPSPVTFDAVLYVDGRNVDVQTIRLAPGITDGADTGDSGGDENEGSPPPGSLAVCVFDELEFGGGGVVEVVLRIDDALKADNHAWSVVREPHHVSVLLVTASNLFLTNALSSLPLKYETMTPAQYEGADDQEILDGERSAFDVVIFDNHSTGRFGQGNYLFWGSVPMIDGVSVGETIDNEIIFNWDDTHPVLRHVAGEAVHVYEWRRLLLPPDAIMIMEGQTSPVMSYLTRGASQFIICAFTLITEDEMGSRLLNTDWPTKVDFIVFMQNVIQFLSSSVTTAGDKTVLPGEPVSIPVPEDVDKVHVRRPDNSTDDLSPAGAGSVHYARTRLVGVYEVEPGVPGETLFAVNLFDQVESRTQPAAAITFGAQTVQARSGKIDTNRPAWTWFLLAVLVVLMLEWVVYNLRIFV